MFGLDGWMIAAALGVAGVVIAVVAVPVLLFGIWRRTRGAGH